MAIKNIFFDLGGVIIDIDYSKTADAFKLLGATNFDNVYSQSKQDSFFDDYDTGKITDEEFRIKLKIKLDIIASDKEFDNAWNAMLLDLPIQRLHFIQNLKKHYKLFLLSNTNAIHLNRVFNICQTQNNIANFDGFFDKEYYSHTLGKRKPNVDAFTHILIENNLSANETLFIDDSLQHILGAQAAGLHTLHVTQGVTIFDLANLIEKINKNSNESQNYSRLTS